MYFHLFLLIVKLYKLIWIPVSFISNSYSLIFNNIDTTYSNRYYSTYVGSFSILYFPPVNFQSLISSSSSSTLSSTIFPCFINCVLLEKYDLMMSTGSYSSGVKVFSTAFQPVQQTICFLTFLPSSYILFIGLFWVSVSHLCTLPGIPQSFFKWCFEPLVEHVPLDCNDDICFLIKCGVLWWNLFTHLSATLDTCVWFSTSNLWCPKFRCFSNLSFELKFKIWALSVHGISISFLLWVLMVPQLSPTSENGIFSS